MTAQTVAEAVATVLGLPDLDLARSRSTAEVTSARAMWWQIMRTNMTRAAAAKFLNRERTTLYHLEKVHLDSMWALEQYRFQFKQVQILARFQHMTTLCQPCDAAITIQNHDHGN